MNVIIYHHNSFGGTYEHAINLYNAYAKREDVNEINMLLPRNAKFEGDGVYKFLCRDVVQSKYKIVKRLHFLYRTFINPFKLLNFIFRKDVFVIFNEFEQLSSFLWSPIFRLLKRRNQKYAVILHDPDRDNYFASKYIAGLTMSFVLNAMDIGFYHELLPDRKYYGNNKIEYMNVSPGIYPKFNCDQKLLDILSKRKKGKYCCILGNIRPEKNYHLAIQSLKEVSNLQLIIAGRPANSGVNINELKALANDIGVANRIIWIERFLSDEELSSIITLSDLVLLTYSSTFKSQSGVLFLVAPYRKKIVASGGESALALLVKKYKLGSLVQPDSLESLVTGIKYALETETNPNWDELLQFATWDKNVEISLKTYCSL